MPEKVGTVTGLIKKRDGTVFGLNIDGDEYLYSFPDKRAEPWEADKVSVGDVIRVEYSPYEKDGKTKQYLAVIEKMDLARGSGLPATFNASGELVDPAPSTWGFEQKDKLIARESCLKATAAIFAAAIEARVYTSLPAGLTITSYADALYEWMLGAPGPTEPDEVPFE